MRIRFMEVRKEQTSVEQEQRSSSVGKGCSPTPHRIVAFLLRRKSFDPKMAR